MAFIDCPDCGKSLAKVCPSCGRPNSKRYSLPKTRASYALISLFGFLCSIIFLAILRSFAPLMFPLLHQHSRGLFSSIFAFLSLFSALTYLIDIAIFEPFSLKLTDVGNKFSYIIIGPYFRILHLYQKRKYWWLSLLTALMVVYPAIFVTAENHLQSKSFLDNSKIVVQQLTERFKTFDRCGELKACEEEYKELVDSIKTYAVPREASGFAMLITKRDGLFKSISTDIPNFYRRNVRALRSSDASEVVDPIIVDFEPLSSHDFRDIVQTFRTCNDGSVRVIEYLKWGTRRQKLIRSLHSVEIGGQSFVLYIASDQGFLMSARDQEIMSQ